MTDDRNLSTDHQNEGDARKPNDTLDRDQDGNEGLTPDSPGPSQGTDTGIGESGDMNAPQSGDFDPENGTEDAQKAESDTPDYS